MGSLCVGLRNRGIAFQESNLQRSGFESHTVEIFVKVASTYPTPFHLYKGLFVGLLRRVNILHSDVLFRVKSRCSHIGLLTFRQQFITNSFQVEHQDGRMSIINVTTLETLPERTIYRTLYNQPGHSIVSPHFSNSTLWRNAGNPRASISRGYVGEENAVPVSLSQNGIHGTQANVELLQLMLIKTK